ncbi:hypothetical protein CDAR_41851 [Caerostris darwini]|uniref:Uncharacterized protein n=1 Tax=Caerostris darwini TaxID=1538125 RepID=A0AAV4V2J0_9ARAC|nr:hypothetical protein CDAR_41851 [Caerostris darwini]
MYMLDILHIYSLFTLTCTLRNFFTDVVAGDFFEQHLPRLKYLKCFEGLNGILITIQVLSEGKMIRKTVERIASRKKGPPYKPEKISQYNIDIHEETKFSISRIIESFVNEELVGGDPIAVAEIKNSFCSVSNIRFTKSKVLHFNIPNLHVVEHNFFYEFRIDLQSTDSDLENKCLRKLKKKSLVRFASSYYMKTIGNSLKELIQIFQDIIYLSVDFKKRKVSEKQHD